mmetsp:Transcript_10322/g.33865  ORF Transcript_10322/g.33865 Transcript_10322/m.33865 type:complete len:733 (+) Transcript_10322:604-2802(+)
MNSICQRLMPAISNMIFYGTPEHQVEYLRFKYGLTRKDARIIAKLIGSTQEDLKKRGVRAAEKRAWRAFYIAREAFNAAVSGGESEATVNRKERAMKNAYAAINTRIEQAQNDPEFGLKELNEHVALPEQRQQLKEENYEGLNTDLWDTPFRDIIRDERRAIPDADQVSVLVYRYKMIVGAHDRSAPSCALMPQGTPKRYFTDVEYPVLARLINWAARRRVLDPDADPVPALATALQFILKPKVFTSLIRGGFLHTAASLSTDGIQLHLKRLTARGAAFKKAKDDGKKLGKQLAKQARASGEEYVGTYGDRVRNDAVWKPRFTTGSFRANAKEPFVRGGFAGGALLYPGAEVLAIDTGRSRPITAARDVWHPGDEAGDDSVMPIAPEPRPVHPSTLPRPFKAPPKAGKTGRVIDRAFTGSLSLRQWKELSGQVLEDRLSKKREKAVRKSKTFLDAEAEYNQGTRNMRDLENEDMVCNGIKRRSQAWSRLFAFYGSTHAALARLRRHQGKQRALAAVLRWLDVKPDTIVVVGADFDKDPDQMKNWKRSEASSPWRAIIDYVKEKRPGQVVEVSEHRTSKLDCIYHKLVKHPKRQPKQAKARNRGLGAVLRRFYAKHPDEAEELWHGDADAAARDLGAYRRADLATKLSDFQVLHDIYMADEEADEEMSDEAAEEAEQAGSSNEVWGLLQTQDGRTFHRDVSAAVNILRTYITYCVEGDVPLPFRKGTPAESLQ